MPTEYQTEPTRNHRLDNWLIGLGVALVLVLMVGAFLVGGRVSFSAGEVEMRLELVKGEGVALTFIPLEG